MRNLWYKNLRLSIFTLTFVCPLPLPGLGQNNDNNSTLSNSFSGRNILNPVHVHYKTLNIRQLSSATSPFPFPFSPSPSPNGKQQQQQQQQDKRQKTKRPSFIQFWNITELLAYNTYLAWEGFWANRLTEQEQIIAQFDDKI